MTKSTDNFADTTDILQSSGVVDDVLKSLRISGSLLLREPYAAPWSVAIPDAARLAQLLGTDGRVVAFHMVEYGHCQLDMDPGGDFMLRAGEMAICFGGAAHRLFLGKAAKTQPVEELLAGHANARRPGTEAGPADTALLCGVFVLHDTEFNPLVAALPPVMVSSLTRQGELHNLSGVARLLAEEVERKAWGSGFVIERLLEVLCAEAMRAYIETVPGQETGWLRGIRDPVVGRAIAAIHSRPGDAWSVERMARSVSMSPSRFAARFSGCIGDSPMAYITRWRMSLACRELSSTRKRIEQIAGEVGYESLPAFSRAFKKLVGVSPAGWRSRARKSSTRVQQALSS